MQERAWRGAERGVGKGVTKRKASDVDWREADFRPTPRKASATRPKAAWRYTSAHTGKQHHRAGLTAMHIKNEKLSKIYSVSHNYNGMSSVRATRRRSNRNFELRTRCSHHLMHHSPYFVQECSPDLIPQSYAGLAPPRASNEPAIDR